eukprot:Skav213980  [mRNA]  locus=scaffold2200:514504:518935:- [translate_table: standard]
MRWQPCDASLSFRGTWLWLPREEEEELLGPTTFEQAFQELLQSHRCYDPACWMDRTVNIELELGDQRVHDEGLSATHFFIGDDDTVLYTRHGAQGSRVISKKLVTMAAW